MQILSIINSVVKKKKKEINFQSDFYRTVLEKKKGEKKFKNR